MWSLTEMMGLFVEIVASAVFPFSFSRRHNMGVAFCNLKELGDEGLVWVINVDGGCCLVGFQGEQHF